MEKNKRELLKIILKIKKLDLLEQFLKDLLTPKEYEEIVKRWQIVKQLSDKVPQWQIGKNLKVSRSKITRGSRVLYSKSSFFNKILAKK